MGPELPNVVSMAVADHHRRQGHRSIVTASIRPGDIRAATSGHLRRLVCVLRDPHVNADGEQSVVVALIHPYVEYATGADRIVDSSVSGLPYVLVVERDLVGVVFPDQLDPSPLAHLAHGTLRIAPRGPDLLGPFDARWQFKQRELEDLHELVADCTTQALNRM